MNVPAAAQALDVARYYAGAWALLPEYVVAFGAVVLLLVDAFAKNGSGGRRPAYIALGVLGLSLVATLATGGTSATLFSGMVVVDPFSQFWRVLFLLAGGLGVLLALHSDELGEKNTGEYYSMFLGLVLGMMLLAASSDLVMLYIALELVSLMSYVLVGFRRHDRRSAEAALKYVIYGGAASGVMLFGLSLIYGITGETQLSLINGHVLEMARDAYRGLLDGAAAKVALPAAMTAGLVLSFAGFAYKISAAPLHMWSPDVYEGAPTPFTAFLSTGPKAAGFAALIRFFIVGFSDPGQLGDNLLAEVSSLPWPQLICVVSIATMIIGNFAAIGQNNVKRFLAYSSIAHAGYSLIGLAAFSKSGAASVLLYMVFYLAMNVGAFYCAIWVREKLGSELISEYKGLGTRAPLVAITMAIFLFSLTGLPPLSGFIGKYYLFAAIVDRAQAIPVLAECAPALRDTMSFGQKLGCTFQGSGIYYATAIIGVLNSAISLYYYARIIRNMFLEKAQDPSPIEPAFGAKAVLVPLSVFVVVTGIYWAPIEAATRNAVDFRRPTLAEVQPAPTPRQLAAEAAADAAKPAETTPPADKPADDKTAQAN
ncbi:NADH-quinone oxidoreductase subunit N [Myxococcota bacterium]|nr:NADH-quinone oxidoreductase subunit N [Myxococcota bacterium]